MGIVKIAAAEQRQAALELLFSHLSASDRAEQVRQLDANLRRRPASRSGLLVVERGGTLAAACLYALDRDGTAFVWPPRPAGPGRAADCDLLLGEVRRQLDARGAWLGQSLLDPDNAADGLTLARNGFARLTDLSYRQRLLAVALPEEAVAGLDGIAYRPGENHARFARVLEETYAGTLDCPGIQGLRTGAEALDGHKASGEFDAARWKLFVQDGRDVGVLLMNDHPDQDAWEVVYTGVVPQARGRGLGRAILLEGLRAAQAARRQAVVLAVDAGNVYATRIYDALGFTEFARRAVYVRPGRRVSAESSTRCAQR